MGDFMMNIFSDAKKNIKSKIDKELLNDVSGNYAQSEKSYPQDFVETVDNSVEKLEEDNELKGKNHSWNRFDSRLEKNFEKSKQEKDNSVNCAKDEISEIVDSVDQTNCTEDIPKKKDIIKHFEMNLQKYSSKCDISQEELENQEIPSGILQYLYSIFSKVGRRLFRKILILIYSFKEIDIKDKVLILSALGYLISPIDMIPDTLLGIGFADDGVIISYIYNKIINEVSDQTIERVDNLLSSFERSAKPEKSAKSDVNDVSGEES